MFNNNITPIEGPDQKQLIKDIEAKISKIEKDSIKLKFVLDFIKDYDKCNLILDSSYNLYSHGTNILEDLNNFKFEIIEMPFVMPSTDCIPDSLQLKLYNEFTFSECDNLIIYYQPVNIGIFRDKKYDFEDAQDGEFAFLLDNKAFKEFIDIIFELNPNLANGIKNEVSYYGKNLMTEEAYKFSRKTREYIFG